MPSICKCDTDSKHTEVAHQIKQGRIDVYEQDTQPAHGLDSQIAQASVVASQHSGADGFSQMSADTIDTQLLGRMVVPKLQTAPAAAKSADGLPGSASAPTGPLPASYGAAPRSDGALQLVETSSASAGGVPVGPVTHAGDANAAAPPPVASLPVPAAAKSGPPAPAAAAAPPPVTSLPVPAAAASGLSDLAVAAAPPPVVCAGAVPIAPATAAGGLTVPAGALPPIATVSASDGSVPSSVPVTALIPAVTESVDPDALLGMPAEFVTDADGSTTQISIANYRKHYMAMRRVCKNPKIELPNAMTEAFAQGGTSRFKLFEKFVKCNNDLKAISLEVVKERSRLSSFKDEFQWMNRDQIFNEIAQRKDDHTDAIIQNCNQKGLKRAALKFSFSKHRLHESCLESSMFNEVDLKLYTINFRPIRSINFTFAVA